MELEKNSNDYIINIIKKNQEKGFFIEYIQLTILNNFESENESININYLFKGYSDSSYFSQSEHNVLNTHMYYGILKDKITEVMELLDSIHTQNKYFKYLLAIKYINKDNYIRIKINKKGKKITTLNATKSQPL
tara:strand:+ start:2244 stop:2645 length:402 start_codon:yes stop_codon:yes gene_type:complete